MGNGQKSASVSKEAVGVVALLAGLFIGSATYLDGRFDRISDRITSTSDILKDTNSKIAQRITSLEALARDFDQNDMLNRFGEIEAELSALRARLDGAAGKLDVTISVLISHIKEVHDRAEVPIIAPP